MASRNRTEGHNWERRCVVLLRHIFPFITTSRSESKARDDAKIDLMNHDEYTNGYMPFEFQCKSSAGNLNYQKVLDEMPGRFPKVVLQKRTEKRGSRFYEVGTYAIMHFEDFIKLLEDGNKQETEANAKKAVP
jgi:hypothetical protein